MTKRVLFVDDNPSIRETEDIVLPSDGYEVTLAASGPEGLAVLRSGFHGLVLLDIMMPEMGGWEVVAAMKDEGLLEGNAICMLTAMQNPGSELDDMKDCVQDYIRKPFTLEELQEAVAQNISWIG